MKHVGIVACSAEGAALCYQTLCRDAVSLVGRHDHPRVTMDSIPMAAWMPAFDAGDWSEVAGFMLREVRRKFRSNGPRSAFTGSRFQAA